MVKNYQIIESSVIESEYIKSKLMEFNNSQVPFTQEKALISKNYIIKNNETIIAGVHSYIYYWKVIFVERLFIDENYRGHKLGSLLLSKV
jgi:GNAT superfamily N-acetyltransferase